MVLINTLIESVINQFQKENDTQDKLYRVITIILNIIVLLISYK